MRKRLVKAMCNLGKNLKSNSSTRKYVVIRDARNKEMGQKRVFAFR